MLARIDGWGVGERWIKILVFSKPGLRTLHKKPLNEFNDAGTSGIIK